MKDSFYIVEERVLPDAIRRVAAAKKLLESDEVATVSEAARRAGISRSAFYKYKDAVRPFKDLLSGRIITFQALLQDRPGVLSSILSVFAGSGANILTINQNIPTNGCAAVTIAAETSSLRGAPEDLMREAAAVEGVIRIEILAG